MRAAMLYPSVWSLLALVLSGVSDAGRVLIYPYGHCLNSHLLNAEKLSRILLEGGHEVDMLVSTAYQAYTHRQAAPSSPDPVPEPRLLQFPSPDNYTPVCEYDTMDFMLYTPIRQRFDAFIHTSVLYCDSLLSTAPLMTRLKQARYDLFILEALDPCSRVLADYLDVPFAPLITAGLGHWDGNPRPPSYLPATIAPYTPDMSFIQRSANLLMKAAYELIPVVLGFDVHFEALKVKHGLNLSLSLGETFQRAAVKFVNSDFAIDYPAPVEPDTVLVGGFAVERDPPTLDPDLEEFMASSGEHGVIVMSFGTLTKRFDQAWTKVFVEAFSRLPQKVIWRYYPGDEEFSPLDVLNVTVGDRIKAMTWLPQASLLKHPKTRLFVTHCGLNGMFETTHYGVPIVAVPLSGDQFQHAVKLTEHLRMGVTVDASSLTANSLYLALQTVLNSPEYALNARLVSARLKDQPMTPASRLAYWADYLIRHGGAPHLKSRAHTLTWIQYYCLDTISCLAVGILGLLLVLGLLVRRATRVIWNWIVTTASRSMHLRVKLD